jgi:hypothetical protein
MRTPWTGNWQQRLKEKLTVLGFDTVRSFVMAREGKTFGELARELEPDVAPVQVEMLYLRESLDEGRLVEAAAECLARTVIERFPRGWGTGGRLEYRTAGVMVDWVSDMLLDLEQSELDEPSLKAVAAALKDTVQPPTGWLPKNGQDPLIQQAFKIGLRQEDK